jgi:hypothetical protein
MSMQHQDHAAYHRRLYQAYLWQSRSMCLHLPVACQKWLSAVVVTVGCWLQVQAMLLLLLLLLLPPHVCMTCTTMRQGRRHMT